MKELPTGKDRVQKICDLLKKETLDPAKQEAKEIVENAKMQSEQILNEAKQEAKRVLENAEQEVALKKKALDTSLQLASKQAVEKLKQTFEGAFFSPAVASFVDAKLQEPKAIAQILETLLTSIDGEGEIEALIPKDVSEKSVHELLSWDLLKRLETGAVSFGDFRGGAQVKVKDKSMTLDVSDEVVRELLGQLIRSDFRKFVFGL